MTTPTNYTGFNNLYNSDRLSDVTLHSGNVDFCAHKVILMGASAVFYAAFSSKLPVASKDSYNIAGHSTEVVYGMLRHIYGLSVEDLNAPASNLTTPATRLDFLFNVFLLANEYQIPSLGQTITTIIRDIIFCHYFINGLPDKQKFTNLIAKTAKLYNDSDIADESLLDGVVEACLLPLTGGLHGMERRVKISTILESWDLFGSRLLRRFGEMEKENGPLSWSDVYGHSVPVPVPAAATTNNLFYTSARGSGRI